MKHLQAGPTAFAFGLGLMMAAAAVGRPWPVIVAAFLFWPVFSVLGQWFL